MARSVEIDHSCRHAESAAPDSAAKLDRFEAAVLFAITEASRVRRRTELGPVLTLARGRR